MECLKPKPLTHMVNSRGGIVGTLGLCLAGCFCQLDFVEVASLGAPGIFRGLSIPTHAYRCVQSTGKAVLNCQQLTEVSQTPKAKTCVLL